MSDALKLELDVALDEALDSEARNNEKVVAWTRIIVLGLTNVVGLLTHETVAGMQWWEGMQGRMMLVWLAAGFGTLALLRVTWHRAFSYVIPLVDGLALLAVLVNGREVLMGTVHPAWTAPVAAAVCALLMVVGAIRLRVGATVFSCIAGLGIYVAVMWPYTTPNHFTSTAAMVGLAGVVAWLTFITRKLARARRTRGMLSRFLPDSVVDAAHDDPLALLTQARSADVTVLFTDIRGFTTWSESRSPTEVMTMLNNVQGALAGEVARRGGTVDKFLGDGMLAFFEGPEHADRAVDTAVACIRVAGTFKDLKVGVGLQSGEVVIGCLGQQRLEFTVLGDTVNTASRLESMTKELGVPILAGDGVAKRSKRKLDLVAEVSIRGKAAKMQVYSRSIDPM